MILKKTTPTEIATLATEAKAQNKKMIPVIIEMIEDMLTPVLAFLTLQCDGVPSFLYESVVGGEKTSRYSFMGFDPFRVFTYQKGRIKIIDRNGLTVRDCIGDPRQILQAELDSYSMLEIPGLPSFCGGLVGNFGYDTIRLTEPQIPDQNPDDLGLPDISLMYFDVVIAFDHVLKKISLIHLINVDDDLDVSYRDAMNHLEGLYEQLLNPKISDLIPGNPTSGVESNMTQAEFEAMVLQCKDRIIAGDVFQVVISQRFSCALAVDPFTIYRCLRQKNPAPYLFFLDFGQWQLVGSSPEIMVNVVDRQVDIHPLAGTRKRGKDEAEDQALSDELSADPKERSEHEMLIDLARNDVARISIPGSVKVTKRQEVVKYATVMHISSEVTGKLKEELTPLDALWTSLPAGTLSGAPKISAMKIIEDLEPTRRGPYGGCVGFLGFDANIVTAIVIRTAVIVNDKIWYQAGAGIVYDSEPASEWEETCRKGASILRALVMAGNTKEESA